MCLQALWTGLQQQGRASGHALVGQASPHLPAELQSRYNGPKQRRWLRAPVTAAASVSTAKPAQAPAHTYQATKYRFLSARGHLVRKKCKRSLSSSGVDCMQVTKGCCQMHHDQYSRHGHGHEPQIHHCPQCDDTVVMQVKSCA